MNFCKCFLDPRSCAAGVSLDKLVPGEDSDKVNFKIKVQKLAHRIQEAARDAAVTMATG